MIPIIDNIIPDELFTSWLQHLADINEVSVSVLFTRFSHCPDPGRTISRFLYPLYLERFCRNESQSALIPSLPEILRRHTPFYMTLSFFSSGLQARVLERCLHEQPVGSMTVRGRIFNSTFQVCPLCIQEDMRDHGRIVVHVPHQGATCCLKHKVKLVPYVKGMSVSGLSAAIADLEELPWNTFYQSLYDNPVITNGDTLLPIYKTFSESGSSIEQREIKHFYSNRFFRPDVASRVFSRSDVLPSEQEQKLPDNPAFTVHDTHHFPLLRVLCNRCHQEFWTHAFSIKMNIPCPFCREKMSKNQVMNQLYSNDSQRSFFLEHDNHSFFRGELSKKVDSKRIRNHWDYFRTDMSSSQNMKNSRIGESFPLPNGDSLVIADYKDANHIIVEDSSGFRYTSTYRSMKRKIYPNSYLDNHPEVRRSSIKDRNRDRYLGLMRTVPNGDTLTITAYHSSKNIEVTSSFGGVYKLRLSSWLEGSYPLDYLNQYPEVLYSKEGGVSRRKTRLGETTSLPNGETMTIIEYKNTNHILIRFSDGYIFPSSYHNFKCRALPLGYLHIHPELKEFSSRHRHQNGDDNHEISHLPQTLS